MLSESLLKKVRDKERAQIEARMTVEDPETIRKRARVEQLVEAVDFLAANFATMRHPSAFLDTLVGKYVTSKKAMGVLRGYAVV